MEYNNENNDKQNSNNEQSNEFSSSNYVAGDGFVMRVEENTQNQEQGQYQGESYTMGVNQNSNESNQGFNGTSYNYQNTTMFNGGEIKPKKKRKFIGKRILSYILVGILCTGIGGAASGYATLYVLPKTNLFKDSSFYKSLTGNTSSTDKAYTVSSTTSTKTALTVSEIAEKVGPAVVGVSTKSVASSGLFGRNQVQEGMGSGMIINQEGYVLTNYHVVQGAQEVKVILSSGKEVNAKVVNYDQSYDVAVVKITDDIQVPGYVELGDSSNLQVGEGVVAIGNPLGRDFLGTVTSGVVSAVNRAIDDTNKDLKYIQTDTAINSGNSGGPLINASGQVIGINTAKIGETGVEGLGFAIPINAVKDKIKDLSKPVIIIGITGVDVTDALAKQYKITQGVYIQEVQEFSAAEKAGIRVGDIITKFGGEKIKSVSDINKVKAKHKAGDIIKVEVDRDGKTKQLDLKLSE